MSERAELLDELIATCEREGWEVTTSARYSLMDVVNSVARVRSGSSDERGQG